MSIDTVWRSKLIKGEISPGLSFDLGLSDFAKLIGSVNEAEAFGYPPGFLMLVGSIWCPDATRIDLRLGDKEWPWAFDRADFSPLTARDWSLADPVECEELLLIPE
jgi:hypothetical protein